MLLGTHDLNNYNDENAYWVRRAVVEMLRHPEYRPYQKPNDIALLRLDRLVNGRHLRLGLTAKSCSRF